MSPEPNALVAYIDLADGFYGLRSSTVIVISGRGKVHYAGSASDEG